MMDLPLPHGYKFYRLDAQKMTKLKADWSSECVLFDQNFDDYATPSIIHAANIAEENPPDRRYGIFALESPDGTVDCIVHINHGNLPGPAGYTLRVLWALLSPRFDFEDISPELIGGVITGVTFGALALAKGEMPSQYVKFHMGSMPDRGILSGIARTLESVRAISHSTMKGNWLQMTLA